MRAIAREKLGYYPLAPTEAERIRGFLILDPSGSPGGALDPCAGTGAALATITAGTKTVRYGIELDAYRAKEAERVLDSVVHGNVFDTHCAVESFSCIFENPPYDFEVSEGRNTRMERLFLEHTYRWLKPGGVLILVIPGDRLATCVDVLSVHFRNKALYRLREPEAQRYKQIVVFGVRRTKREREQLRDLDVSRAKAKLLEIARKHEELPILPDVPDRQFAIPSGGPAQLVYRGLPLDTLGDLLPDSGAYRQAARVLIAPELRATGRPLTPLHGGHVGPIRGVADFCCKILGNRLFSRWRHSIVKMFYQMRLLHSLLAPAQ
jgi:tRNA1(Val) A37 N6-methylase TrmN6